jgi:hypothetical protein
MNEPRIEERGLLENRFLQDLVKNKNHSTEEIQLAF